MQEEVIEKVEEEEEEVENMKVIGRGGKMAEGEGRGWSGGGMEKPILGCPHELAKFTVSVRAIN